MAQQSVQHGESRVLLQAARGGPGRASRYAHRQASQPRQALIRHRVAVPGIPRHGRGAYAINCTPMQSLPWFVVVWGCLTPPSKIGKGSGDKHITVAKEREGGVLRGLAPPPLILSALARIRNSVSAQFQLQPLYLNVFSYATASATCAICNHRYYTLYLCCNYSCRPVRLQNSQLLKHVTMQGRRKMKMNGGAKIGRKAANLGGSGGMPPHKI